MRVGLCVSMFVWLVLCLLVGWFVLFGWLCVYSRVCSFVRLCVSVFVCLRELCYVAVGCVDVCLFVG